MVKILKSLSLVLVLISLSSCLKPDPIENETAVSISFVDQLETRGYARDVYATEDRILVAASTAGVQIWDASGSTPVQVYENLFGSKPALNLTLIPEAHLLLFFDKDKGYIRQLDSALNGLSPVYTDFPNILVYESENFGDQNTEDMAITKLNDSLYVLFNSDTDIGDGLRFTYLNRRYEPFEGFYYWEANTTDKYSGQDILGIDARDSLVAVAHGELGIGLYYLVSDFADTLATLDTPGEALEVAFFKDYILSANNWAGLGIYSLNGSDSTLTALASVEVNGWVKHISIWNDMAIVSCGENEIFVIDLSDPAHPRVDQYIPAGYTYRTFIYNDMIYAATREGVKRYSIDSR